MGAGQKGRQGVLEAGGLDLGEIAEATDVDTQDGDAPSAASTERRRVPSPPRLTSRSAPSTATEPSAWMADIDRWPIPASQADARSATATASVRWGWV
jgi:hypothetical protein